MVGPFHKKAWPFHLRFFYLIVSCVLINMLGLLITQTIHVSIFFIDMIGTAIAALLSGLSAGVIVAMLSAFAGIIVVGVDSYAMFGVVNAVGAACWAVLPRTGQKFLGADLFNPAADQGYGKLAGRIAVVGTITGVMCVIASLGLQYIELGFSPSEAGTLLQSSSSGSETGKNTLFLASVLYEVVFGSPFGSDTIWPLILSLVISNIPDKIISTLVAVIVIYSTSTLPNYEFQSKNIHNEKGFRINGRTILCLSMVIYALFLCNTMYHDNMITSSTVISIVIFVAIAIGMAIMAKDYYIRGIDRCEAVSQECWYAGLPSYDLKREVFEDYLKAFLVIFTALNVYIAELPSSPNPPSKPDSTQALNPSTTLPKPHRRIKIDGEIITYDPARFESFALSNLLILTALRYFVVIIMRLTGKFR